MSDVEVYKKLKSGLPPSYIEGLKGFDQSEVIQWLISFTDEHLNLSISALELNELIDSRSARSQQRETMLKLIEVIK